MDPHLNPFSVLSWIIAPALLTNACTLLILSTANRLARAVDRAHEIYRKLENGVDRASLEAVRRIEELKAHQRRSLMLLAALRNYYVACGSFAMVTLISIVGAVVASLGAPDLVRVLEVCGTAAGLLAVGAFIYGSVPLTRETSIVGGCCNNALQNGPKGSHSLFVVINDPRHFAATVLLAVRTLLPIVDPLSGAPLCLPRGAFPNAAS